MFASLVVVLPTEFKGGELVLRHDGMEYTWDPAELMNASGKETSVQYIAFYSDVEHEVLPVTEGYRVTLTYVSPSQPPTLCHRANMRLRRTFTTGKIEI